MEEKNYKQYLKDIKTLVFDVDGVLTNGSVTITTDGELLRAMNIKDGYALKTALDAGMTICVITGGTNEGVKKRLRALGITDIYLGVTNKEDQLKEFIDVYNIDPKTTLYMGDDLPDLYAMNLVALPCCPQDAAPEIKEISKYISHKKGGEGAVRDIIEQVLKVQGKWNSSPTS